MPVKSPSMKKQDKMKYKAYLFGQLCSKKFGGEITIKQIRECVKTIKENDPQVPAPPGAKASKKKLRTWMIENINAYNDFLDNVIGAIR